MDRLAILSVHTSPIATPGGKKVGGMNTYVREIAQEFASRGIPVDIYTHRTSRTQPAVDNSLGENVNVIHVNVGIPGPLTTNDILPHIQQFTAGVIAHTIKNNIRYDLIFSHYWVSGLVAQKLKEAWGTPFIQMFHTLGHMKNRIPSGTASASDTRIQAETRIVEWADLIIANTEAERAQLLWLYRADRRKIVVCSAGVNTDRFHPIPRQQAYTHLGIPQHLKILLFAGRIEPLKAVDSIIEALSIIKQEAPEQLKNARFVVVGGDPHDMLDSDMVALKRLTRDLGLTNFVQFVGAKSQDELIYYYAAATTVIMPSEYESFGMVALEAMATGTPVIASEVGGLAFLVKDNETGYLVPARSPRNLADRIRRILANPDLRDEMGQKAAARATQYTWPVIADKLLNTFHTLLANPAHQKRVS